MPIPDRLKKIPIKQQSREPLWKGPEKDGITFSMLSRFLVCRERFRLLVMEGLRTEDQFNHKIEYGQMWHICEEALARGNDPTRGNRYDRTRPLWEDDLKEYARRLVQRYPLQQEQVSHWYEVCKAQFPIYVRYWEKHPDVLSRTPLLQEHVFDLEYALPSGRKVRLRGKWDSVDLISQDRSRKVGIYLQENKSKGDINEERIKRQLTFDLQTMLYLVALTESLRQHRLGADVFLPEEIIYGPEIVNGVRYNVVRRPLSGGKGTIIRHKATSGAKCPACKGQGQSGCRKCGGAGRVGGKPEESPQAFYKRVTQYIESEPSEFFARWKVEITEGDIVNFRQQCLDPILEQLCDWWAWIDGCRKVGSNVFEYDAHHGYGAIHWRHPFGVYNVMDEGGSSDLDEYLTSGSTVGLRRVNRLFEELES